jgi:hypothetical protein
MSRFWPHTPYAEDQPLAGPILYTHVFTRAIQTGSLLSLPISTALFLYRRPPTAYLPTLLRGSGVGVAIATGMLAIATPIRMWDQQPIQWQDRSWRLLENKGQIECDDWTYAGMAVGLLGTAGRGLGWRGVVGGAGVGSVVGMLGYMGWRHGVKEGKFEEERA